MPDSFHPNKPWLRKQPEAISTGPVVLALDIVSDRIAGGITVTITGQNFWGRPTVLFGSTAGTSVAVVSRNTITVVVPAHVAGLVDLTVTIGSQSGTLANAFTYIQGFITSVTPPFCLVTGGIQVVIRGGNFLAGSIIKFGTVASATVTFVDSNQYLAIVPASVTGGGPVDITIIEPVTLTHVVGSGLFIYTAVIPAADIRKKVVTIQDNLNNAPNQCSFLVDGQSSPPTVGTSVDFVDNSILVFRGIVQSSEQLYEGLASNRVWKVNAVDRTFLFNRKRPFGIFVDTSVSDVVIALTNQFAPDFTTEFVQTNLVRVSVVFDGTEDMATAMSRLAQLTGEGHWYIDYYNRVHFYHVKPLAIPTSLLPSTVLTPGPGTPMTVTESTTPFTVAFEPGWYYFKSTAEYGNTPTFNTSLVPAPSNYVQLSNEAAVINLTGAVSNGPYSPDGVNIFPRGWAGWNGVTYIPEGTWPQPSAGPNVVYFASPDVAAVLEAMANYQFEASYSPISNAIYLSQYQPTFHNIPIAANIGTFAASARRIYFVRYSDLSKLGGTRTTGYVTVGDNVTVLATAEPVYSYNVQPVPYVNVAAAPLGVPVLAESTVNLGVVNGVPPTVFQSGYYAVCISGVYQDGTESYPSDPSNTVFLTGLRRADLTALPIFSTINTVPCIFRKVYISYSASVHNLPDFRPGHTNLTYIIVDNATATVTIDPSLALSGGDGDPSYPVGVPLGIALSSGNFDGPWLEDVDKPDDLTDANLDILHDPPFVFSTDYSQIRNRVYVKGKGTTLTADAAIDDVTISVGDISSFFPTGGKFIFGSRVIAYTSVGKLLSGSVIRLASPLLQPMSMADWQYGGGNQIRPFIQVDDVKSQRDIGVVELDPDGHPTDGVHEYTIDDNSLATGLQCIVRGLGELQLFARPIIRLRYSTTDPKSRSGKIVTVNKGTPALVGDFIIQSVTIDRYHDENNILAPRYNVEADNAARFNLNDLILYLDDRVAKGASGGPSLAGIVTGQGGVSGIPNPTSRRQAEWAQVGSPGIQNGPSGNTGAWQLGFGTDNPYRDPLTGIMWRRQGCDSVGHTQCGWFFPPTANQIWVETLPKLIVHFRTGPSVKNLRIWCGLSPVAGSFLTEDDDLAAFGAPIAGFGFVANSNGMNSSGGVDTGFRPFASGGGTNTVTFDGPYSDDFTNIMNYSQINYPSLVRCVADTEYLITVEVTKGQQGDPLGVGRFKATINGVSQADVPIPPSCFTLAFGPFLYAITPAALTGTNTRILDWDSMYIERNG